MIWSGAPSESYERSENCLTQPSCVVAGAEECHLGVASGREIVGITYAEVPKLSHEGTASLIGTWQPLFAQDIPVFPDELLAGRGAVKLY